SDPGPIHAHDVDDAAGLDPLGRLLDQALEDPRVAGAPGVAQADGGEGVGHGCQFTWAACPHPNPPPQAGEGARPDALPVRPAPPSRQAGEGARPDALRRRGALPPPLAGEGWGGGKPPDPCIPAIRRHPWRMHLRSADEPRDPVAQRAADKRRLANAVRGSLGFVLLLVVVFGLQGLGDTRALAVGPGSAAGLVGLLTAPLLHGSPAHLVANASALLILGTLALAVYPRATVRALPLMWLG